MKHIYSLTILLIFSSLAVSQECKDSITASTPDSRFSINGQEVTDTVTGLIWQKCPLGKTGSDCSAGSIQSLTWEGALQAAVTEAQITGKGWRLPNIKELNSIVEEKCVDPAINVTNFPNTKSGFWSASLYFDDFDTVWVVNFGGGGSGAGFRPGSEYVRLVRTEQ